MSVLKGVLHDVHLYYILYRLYVSTTSIGLVDLLTSCVHS